MGINVHRYIDGGQFQPIHGDSQNKNSPYESWKRMRQRCYNPNFKPAFHRYGGRGIKVCLEWQKYESFREWALTNGWKKGLQLDRIDVDGDYSPSNCRWVTKAFNTWRRWHTDESRWDRES